MSTTIAPVSPFALDLPAAAATTKPLTFIGNMADLANVNAVRRDEEREEKRMRFDEARDAREQVIMTNLSALYLQPLKDAILGASENGKREKYMNFNRDSCKANFPTLGPPSEVLTRWLNDITDPNSKYAPTVEDQPQHLGGLTFDVWNNGAFTVRFAW